MGVASWDPCGLFDELPYIEVLTLPKGAKFKGCLTCNDLYCPDTHWIGRRTLPCMGEDCAACEANKPKRHEAFGSFVWNHNHRHQIARLSVPVAVTIKRALTGVVDYRGQVVHLERKGDRKNGRLVAYVDDYSFPQERLPAAPNLVDHLSRVWRIDGIDPGMGDSLYMGQLQCWLAQVEASRDDREGGANAVA